MSGDATYDAVKSLEQLPEDILSLPGNRTSSLEQSPKDYIPLLSKLHWLRWSKGKPNYLAELVTYSSNGT